MELRDGQMITKETFIGAKFIDNERQFVEVMLNMDHTEEINLTPLVIEADEENPHFQDLMGLVSMDQLHEDTCNEKKAESDAFIETAKAVMMESGLLEAETALSKTKMFPTLVENIFTNMENEDHLFALKLALFELQDIRESENVEEKTALRKAQNKIDILQHAFNIMGVKVTGDDAPATTDPVANAKALDKAEATMAAELKMPKHHRPATVARKTAATVAKKNPPKKGKK